MSRKPQGENIITLPVSQQQRDVHDLEFAIDALSKVDLAELYAKRFTKQAIDFLVTVMESDNCKTNDRVRAALALLARGWGNPAIAIRLPDADPTREKNARQIEEEIRAAEIAADLLMQRANGGFGEPTDN